MCRERSWRSERLYDHEMLRAHHDARVLIDFFSDHLAEDAFAELIVVPQRLEHAIAHLVRDHWRGNELRMGMFQARSCCGAVVLEDGDLRNARVQADLVIPLLVYGQ